MSTREVRVRFAPSPTGPLHIGGLRTALYNYLFARKMGGKMLLRIEDTDQNRFVPGAEAYIQEALAWVGIVIDEGAGVGGPHAPYKQSERKPMYREYADKLIAEGNAYYAFDTSEELEAMKERLKAAKVASPSYNMVTRMQMNNSLTLPEDEVKRRLEKGDEYVIRLKVPRKEEIRLNDMIRGWVVVHSSTIDDKVLLKSDGMPTYHLANIVDDHLMEITHVIRGEEWLPSAPLHVLLYRFLGWEDTMPQFAHLPLLLKPDGNGKLSKRDADAGGFPIFPLDWKDPASGDTWMGFKQQGYLQEATTNFLAFLGWNPGTQQELFTMDELIEAFTVERIGKSGTKFDINKAKWYNQQYMRQLPDATLTNILKEEADKHHAKYDVEKLPLIAQLLKERLTFAKDYWIEGQFFFESPKTFDEKVASAKWNAEAVTVISAYKEALAGYTGTFNAENVKQVLHEVLEKADIKIGKIMQALRLALTGVGAGPDLMQLIEIVGKEEVIKRMEFALVTLSEKVNS
jgi:glutamyl-tRNA synthetase